MHSYLASTGDIQYFAESADIHIQDETAGNAASFESDYAICAHLHSLIHEYHDTLAIR